MAKRRKRSSRKKATIRYCKKYNTSGGKRKCRVYGRREMTAKQRKYFS